MKNNEVKKLNSQTRHAFLRSFFEKDEGYEERFVNGFWLVKSWNGDQKFWQVGIFTKDSFARYKTFKPEAIQASMLFNEL